MSRVRLFERILSPSSWVRLGVAVAAVVVMGASAGCGFDCTVVGEKQSFAGCDDLQAAFDKEQGQPNPDGAVLDDLDTCGAANGCNIKP